MRTIFSSQKLHAALTGIMAVVIPIIMVSSPVTAATGSRTSAVVPEFFDGGGYGPTAETAVQQAVWDAETTASAYGLYTCELVGEPHVFPQPPGSLRAFRAQVKLHCTP